MELQFDSNLYVFINNGSKEKNLCQCIIGDLQYFLQELLGSRTGLTRKGIQDFYSIFIFFKLSTYEHMKVNNMSLLQYCGLS